MTLRTKRKQKVNEGYEISCVVKPKDSMTQNEKRKQKLELSHMIHCLCELFDDSEMTRMLPKEVIRFLFEE